MRMRMVAAVLLMLAVVLACVPAPGEQDRLEAGVALGVSVSTDMRLEEMELAPADVVQDLHQETDMEVDHAAYFETDLHSELVAHPNHCLACRHMATSPKVDTRVISPQYVGLRHGNHLDGDLASNVNGGRAAGV